ncbi:MCE family protein [Amycolatopsis acidiphila]|uniref:MCE family protein n=1 Tax=Amycolatopsis acidiphila TaxID=715473 RepID=A0A558AHX3_9PSEU|nr:MCE family protein [Amycolatopsis acidiphila]TVT23868.1 MCE family protein [Amycolatopsis acidiphila]UIJ61157.1 MCE family protein [Amycolatopsis acidiphila]GHG86381.1 ABC transporter substrate-binding protein [Amycolatopsis acidiphila]
MKTFREMNHTRVGVIGVVAVVAAMLILFNITTFPQLTGATEYTADFANAGGLQSGDAVRIGGVQVGKVRDLTLAGDKIVVTFDITDDNARIGDESTLAIKTETLLGRKFLAITGRGAKAADPGAAIPVSRTQVPYDLTTQLGDLATTSGQIDVTQLSQALDSVSGALAGSPPEMKQALTGLSRLSQTISSRDGEIQQLLTNAEGVTGVLADRNKQLTQLFVDGNSLLSELVARRQAIHDLLVNVGAVADQLSGLVKDNQAQLGPTLTHLNSVLDMLRQNEGNIATALEQLGPYATRLGSAISSGPFWDAYIQNLIPGNLIPLPALPGSEGAATQATGGR